MDGIITFKTPQEYNAFLGVETLHPLISVIDFSKVQPFQHPVGWRNEFYVISYKGGNNACGLKYGRNYYDYKEGTLVFIAPHQVVSLTELERNPPAQYNNWTLLFHPELIRGTSLGKMITKYTFFSYEVHEALHLSEQERKLALDCFQNILHELHHAIDNHSKTLICSNIELFLNYCVRFYERQFITRQNTNVDVLSRFEKLLDDYFQSDLPQNSGLPSVKYFADKLNLSANYFGDLLKKETGKNAQEHIQIRLIETAKEKLFDMNKSVSQIAYELGFEYPQYFSRLFKKRVGVSPHEYRIAG